MGTIHKSCYNNTVHRYTTYDKTWEQSVTTGAVITTLYITTHHTISHGNNLLPQELLYQHCASLRNIRHPMGTMLPQELLYQHCASLHNIRQNIGTICNHWSCYNNTVHHYSTYDTPWEQSVIIGAIITTLCITTQHATSHGNNLFPQDLL